MCVWICPKHSRYWVKKNKNLSTTVFKYSWLDSKWPIDMNELRKTTAFSINMHSYRKHKYSIYLYVAMHHANVPQGWSWWHYIVITYIRGRLPFTSVVPNQYYKVSSCAKPILLNFCIPAKHITSLLLSRTHIFYCKIIKLKMFTHSYLYAYLLACVTSLINEADSINAK